MPKFRVVFDSLKINKQKFTVKLKEHLQVHIRLAAREFLKAAIPKIPVWTGFSAGSLGHLASFAGYTYSVNPITTGGRSFTFSRRGSRFRSQTLKQRHYYYHPGGGKVLKTPTAGGRFATPTTAIVKISNNQITFNYNVTISYFNVSDIRKSISPRSPWRSFEAGRKSFFDHLLKVTTKTMPNPMQFIEKETLSYG